MPCGCKFLHIFSHCLHGKLSEGAETPGAGENRDAWIEKRNYVGIFQAKIKTLNSSLACTRHILCKATTNTPPDDLRLDLSLKICYPIE